MRPSMLTITGLTLIATAWGCASTGSTTPATANTTPGLKSLDADTVVSGTTPEVIEGNLGVEQRVASSGLWMTTSNAPSAEEEWQQPTPRLDRMYKLMTPPDPNESATYVYRRTARQ